MKSLLKKLKNPKLIIFTVIFILLTVFSPVSIDSSFTKNSSHAGTLTKVTEVMNMNSGQTMWVTDEAFSKLSLIDWQIIGEKMIDSSLLTNGTLQASTGSSGGWFSKLLEYIINSILGVIYLVLWVVYSIAYGLTLLAEKILEIVLNPTFVSEYLGGFTKKEFVKTAAQLLANLCNMLYLFILIYVAIKAMFGHSDTRNLLVKLIIAALLTNFGLVLAGIVIDFSQVAMYTVWEGIKGTSNSFAPGTKLLDKLQAGFEVGRSVTQVSLWAEILKFITLGVGQAITEILKIAGLIVMSLALIVTLISIAIILMIRIVMIWVLLILTPVAFLFSILPQTEKYWNMWLETLTKYAFTGPILIFFLWLALKLSGTVTSVSKLNEIGNNVPNNGDFKYLFFGLIAKNMSIFFEMGTVIIVLWGGIIIANKFGIAGAKNLDQLIDSTKGLGGGLAKGLMGAGKTIKMGTWRGLRWSKDSNTNMMRKANTEAEALRNEGKLDEANLKQAEADKYKKKTESREKWLRRTLSFAGLTSPKTMKSAVSGWWKNSNEEFFGDSEKALKQFSKRTMDNVFRRKSADVFIAGKEAESNLYDLKNQINKNTDKFKEREIEIIKKQKDIDDATTRGENTVELEKEKDFMTKDRDSIKKEIELQIGRFANRVSKDEAEKDTIVRYLKDRLLDHSPLKYRLTSDDPFAPDGPINANIDEIINLIKSKGSIREDEKIRLYDILEDKVIKAVQSKNGQQLSGAFVDLEREILRMERAGELSGSEASTLRQKIGSLSSQTILSVGGTPNVKPHISANITDQFSNTHSLIRDDLIGSVERKINKNLVDQTKRIAIEEKKKDLETPLWWVNKSEDAIAEADKTQEKRKLSLEQIANIVKAGQGNLAEQTAALRKLSGSAKHFGDLIKKLGESHGGVKGAREFLSNRFSEREVLGAFRTAEMDAIKTHNLYQVGHAAYDAQTGKTHFTSEAQRENILKKTVSSWEPREINQIHPQSFDDKTSIKVLAETINWKNLGENRNFVKNMKESTADLLRRHDKEFLSNMRNEFQDGFRKVRDRVDPGIGINIP